MQALPENVVMIALFNLGGGEVVLILALVLILLGARKLPGAGRGFRKGFFECRDSVRRAVGAIDEESSEAGQSVGGIYGKAAAEALTPDNRVAELYDPKVFRDKGRRRSRLSIFVVRMRLLMRRLGKVIRNLKSDEAGRPLKRRAACFRTFT